MRILPSLSFLNRAPSSTVVPLSDHHQNSFNNLKYSSEERRTDHRIHVNSAIGLLQNMAALVTAKKEILRAVSNPNSSGIYGPDSIEEYLENDVELLDVCNSLLRKIELVKMYADSVKRAGMGPARLTRVKKALDRKKLRENDVGIEKCWSRLKRLVAKEKRRRLRQGEGGGLTGSLTEAVSTCWRLETALSFKKKSRRGSSGADVCTGQMVEMRNVIVLVKKLRDRTAVEESVKKKCDELVDAVGPLEEKVKELYSVLVSIRMALLGILSYQS